LISDSLKDAKEVLTLNKFWLAGISAWGFIIAYVLSVNSFGSDCNELSNIAIIGYTIGVTVSFLDFMLELLQDLSYFCSDDEEDDEEVGRVNTRHEHHLGVPSAWRANFNAPRKYTGCHWFYLSQNVKCGERRTDPFFLFLFEALVRFAGNIALFFLVVLASLNSSLRAAKAYNNQPCLTYFTQNVIMADINMLFWVSIALVGVRALVAFSYPDREAKSSTHKPKHKPVPKPAPNPAPKPPPKAKTKTRRYEVVNASASDETDSSDTDDDDETDDTDYTSNTTSLNTTEQTSLNMDGDEKSKEKPKEKTKGKPKDKPQEKPSDKPAEKTAEKPTEAKTAEQLAHS